MCPQQKVQIQHNHHQEAGDYQDLLLRRNQALHQLHSYVPLSGFTVKKQSSIALASQLCASVRIYC